MIICGYPGIGKTTLSNQFLKYIDLESSAYNRINTDSLSAGPAQKIDEWEFAYVQNAILLSQKPNVDVFISTHEAVRNQVERMYALGKILDLDVAIILPSLNLKDAWIARLEKRVEESEDAIERAKNERALLNAKENYIEHVDLIMRTTNLPIIVIDRIPYDLDEIISAYKSRICMYNASPRFTGLHVILNGHYYIKANTYALYDEETITDSDLDDADIDDADDEWSSEDYILMEEIDESNGDES